MKKSFSKIFLFPLLAFALVLLACTASKKVSQEAVNKIMTKNPENWSMEECESILRAWTQSTWKTDPNATYPVSSSKSVSITATPLNLDVISALARQEALNRRLSVSEFRSQFKEQLENYTGLTIDTISGKIKTRKLPPEYKKEFSFMVSFENISYPHRTIEIDGAYEGFFLENEAGEFGRVTGISGYYADEYFVLDGTLQVTITFSQLTDEGKDLFPDENGSSGFRLVFNGLESKPIIIRWHLK